LLTAFADATKEHSAIFTLANEMLPFGKVINQCRAFDSPLPYAYRGIRLTPESAKSMSGHGPEGVEK
jgi:hypothetical protein